MTHSVIFSGIVLKIASRCNINCTYCYMYNLSDQTYIYQPKFISLENIELLFFRIREYLKETQSKSFHIGLHGGEPLLAGKQLIKKIVKLKNSIENEINSKITISVQTNGLLLNDSWVNFFYENNIGVGISFDGLKEYHDKFRLTKDGQGTHSKVEKIIKDLRSSEIGREIFTNVLCVIHPDMDGKKLTRYFYELGLGGADFLLPDQNYSFQSDKYPFPQENITYGKFLTDAYDEWRLIDDPNFRIRKFGIIVNGFFGLQSHLDSLGMSPLNLFTIETSGEIEPVDTMKCCGESFTKTGHFLRDTSFSEINEIPQIKTGLLKGEILSNECTICEFKNICGGGYLPHRYKDGSFNNPSIYCKDIKHLINHIKKDIKSEIRKASLKTTETINFT